MRRVKAGVIGCGMISEIYCGNLIKSKLVELCACADILPERAEATAERFGIPKVLTVQELIGDPEIELVVNLTVPAAHKEINMAALSAGKHVYCEKPPALNAAETKEILDAAEKAGKRLMFAFNNRARPESRAMIRYIRDGKIGKINSAQAYWVRRCGIPGFGGWYTSKALSGGGPMIDLLHMMDLALYFLGYPEPDYLLATNYFDFMDNKAFKGPWGIPDIEGGIVDVESACHAMLTFKTGQCLLIRSSWAEMNEREAVSVTFQGTKAGGKVERLFQIYELDDTAVDSCTLYTEEYGNQVDMKIHVEKDKSMGRIGAAANFIDSINGKAEPFSAPHEAFLLMKIIDAMYESAAAKKPVQIL